MTFHDMGPSLTRPTEKVTPEAAPENYSQVRGAFEAALSDCVREQANCVSRAGLSEVTGYPTWCVILVRGREETDEVLRAVKDATVGWGYTKEIG